MGDVIYKIGKSVGVEEEILRIDSDAHKKIVGAFSDNRVAGLQGMVDYIFSEGKKECGRNLYPKFIKKQSSKIKKRFAIGFIAASIGITAGIIELTPDISIYDSIINQNHVERSL